MHCSTARWVRMTAILGFVCVAGAAAGAIAHADDAADAKPSGSSLNAQVLAFARGKLGEVVGNGQCTALVIEAYRQVGARRFRPRGPDDDFTWGERLESPAIAQPGDVLQFRDAVFKGRQNYPNGAYRKWEFRYPHHTAVVESVRKTKRGVILTLLHQNVTNHVQDEDEGKPVRRDTINLAELQPSGQVVAYRPVAE